MILVHATTRILSPAERRPWPWRVDPDDRRRETAGDVPQERLTSSLASESAPPRWNEERWRRMRIDGRERGPRPRRGSHSSRSAVASAFTGYSLVGLSLEIALRRCRADKRPGGTRSRCCLRDKTPTLPLSLRSLMYSERQSRVIRFTLLGSLCAPEREGETRPKSLFNLNHLRSHSRNRL